MARMPGAEWRPLAKHGGAMRAFDIICIHTMVGSLMGTDSYFQSGSANSHFGTGGDGRIIQWLDTTIQSWANANGNPHIISIENADIGPEFPKWNTNDGGAVPAFTAKQIEAIAQIVAWACRTHNIPCQIIPDAKPGRRGIGWHRQGVPGYMVAGAEQWSSARGKVCPGDRRIAQIPAIVARAKAILGGQSVALAFPIVGAIRAAYDRPGRAATLRQPLGAEAPTSGSDPVGRYQPFENGHIFWHPAIDSGNAHVVSGDIAKLWDKVGREVKTGFPLTDEVTTPDGRGRFNHFNGGASIYWTPETGPHLIDGEIRKAWQAAGWEQGLGYPTTDVIGLAGGGLFAHFEGGASRPASIYYTEATGAHIVQGAIHDLWEKLGWENGLGYPLTDETPTPDGEGRFNHFSNDASIYWHPNTGAVQIAGAWRAKWASLGYEQTFGYPTMQPAETPDTIGRYIHFTGDRSIYWTPTTGYHGVSGKIRAAWAAQGWETGTWGYPATDETVVEGVTAQDFVGGTASIVNGTVVFKRAGDADIPADEEDEPTTSPAVKEARLRIPVVTGTYRVSQPFKGTAHRGQDYASVTPGKDYSGADILAAADGTVVEARSGVSGFGCWVWLQHTIDGKRVDTIYGHMPASSFKVKAGDKVAAGQKIAEVGSEGDVTGAHLHFEVWTDGRLTGTAVDPAPWLI